MEKGNKNKAIGAGDARNKAMSEPDGEAYCFPDHGVTVRAKSQEEANELLKEVLASRE